MGRGEAGFVVNPEARVIHIRNQVRAFLAGRLRDEGKPILTRKEQV
ncbi:hypothetical protein CUJ84_pRLN3000079 (plasmid) [Rhizobium leguminosarum]|uniref:Uncharacterized protein n=1 Tax=Rhizobium leguminosarum TaxID=384 RepID=A0A2K9ZG36_RHILE|nr:hypothetical protein CUJ84_pRLN3000079 [Rhizobium leguminosarum]